MTKRKLSVLFLTRYPKEGASSRYRVFQYLEELRKLGIHGDVQPFMDERMYALSLKPGNTLAKLWATLWATLRRLVTLLRASHYDIIYMQRSLLPFGPPVLERWLARRGSKLVFDYDDALFIGRPSRNSPLADMFRAPEKTWDIFRLADCTVAGNDWLRDQARKVGTRAETIEVAEDTSRFLPPTDKFAAPSRLLTIGWLGSPSTAKYLGEIEDVLRDIATRYPQIRWQAMGSGALKMDGVPWEVEEWSLSAEREALARYDIGLMPLPDFEWSRGKSGGKARTYMAAAVVPVVSAIGYNLELIRDAETGFLCYSKDDWKAALERLINDEGIRRKIAVAARQDVDERFSVSGQAEKLADLLFDLADGKK